MEIKDLDAVFSKFIRLSYADKDGNVKCFTCPSKLHWKEIQNGHFLSRKNMATRFSEIACKPQCGICNSNCNSGGIKQQVFEKNLREMYGDAIIDELILQSRLTKKYTQYEINELEEYYKDKLLRLMR